MKVNADKVGDRIHVRTPFAYKDRCKRVLGARWSKTARAWTYPLDMETARRLRDEFGNELVLGDDLREWGWVERRKAEQLGTLIGVQDIDRLSEVHLPTVEHNAPTLWAAMQTKSFQPVASLFAASARRSIIADQPGLGKTLESLAALVEANVVGRVLILAPRTSCGAVWQPEIERWLVEVPHTITNVSGKSPKQREELDAQFIKQAQECTGYPCGHIHFYIANGEQVRIKRDTVCPSDICNGDEDWCPEMDRHVNRSTTMRPFIHQQVWSAIIADETHQWLINTRGKAASQVGYGFTKLKVVEDGLKIALSGTPIKGKKHNIFGTLNWLRPEVYTSKWRFVEGFWVVKKEEVDAGRKGIIETRTITNDWLDDKAEAAFFRSLNTIMIRRTKEELRAINPAWMPPAKEYHDVYVDLDGTQQNHYKAMEKGAAASLEGGRLMATGVLAEMTRLKQFALNDGVMTPDGFRPALPSGKFSWLVDFLAERGIDAKGELSDEVHKVVVASQYTSSIKLWAETLRSMGIGCYTLTGETTERERERLIRQFQRNDDVRVFLLNTKAGGVSITLDSADDLILTDETWVPDDQEQVEDRVHRASRTDHQVHIWYLRAKGTIEEAIAKANADKAINNHVVLDAQRGLRFAAERFGTIIKEESS